MQASVLAFFSGTDNNDDKSNYCYSGVVGKLDQPNPATVWRLNLGEERYSDLKIADIFQDSITLPEVPQEWLDKVTVQSYPLYSGAYGGYYGGDWYGNQKTSHGRGSQQTVVTKGPDGQHWESLDNALSTESRASLLKALGEEFVAYLGIPKTPTLPAVELPTVSEYDPCDVIETFFASLAAADTAMLIAMGLGFANIDPTEYPGLRTLGVYEYLVLKDKLIAITDDAGVRGLHIEGIPGIIPVESFIQNDPYLKGYAEHMNRVHNIPLKDIHQSVLLFVEHLTCGMVY